MNSKRKGNRFERNVSKWFTNWTGYKFERVPMSGAWHSNRDATSDIACVDEKHAHRCKISVECKSYKDIKFEHVILGNKTCDIVKFWDQANRDSQRSKKVPILCMRYNSMPREEFFFVVDKCLGEIINKTYNLPHYIVLSTGDFILYVFKASEIVNTSYKYLHKQAKVILRNS